MQAGKLLWKSLLVKMLEGTPPLKTGRSCNQIKSLQKIKINKHNSRSKEMEIGSKTR